MTKRDHKIDKTKLNQPKQGHLQNVRKDVPTRHHCFGKSACGVAFCLYTNACSMENKHGDLDITEDYLLWGYHFMGLTDKVGWIV